MKIFIFLLLLFTTHVEARDYFVATNGKDRNDGSIKRPFASLAKLVAVAQPGDSCYIRGGVYRETLELGVTDPSTLGQMEGRYMGLQCE
jgi:hypothetical protein